MFKRILVTGGAGFIGSHTVDALVRKGYSVRILDNLTPQVHGPGQPKPDYLNPEAEFVLGDLRDREALVKALQGIDAVIHDAAAVGVGQSMYQIAEYCDVNVGGTAMLLDVLVNEKHSVEKLVVASSMSIYGEGSYQCPTHGLIAPRLRDEGQLKQKQWEMTCPHCGARSAPVPTREDKPLYCTSVYAQSKKDQEEYCLITGNAYNIPTVAVRYFNVYGPRQSLSNPYTGACAIFSARIKNDHPPLIYEDGVQSRDFTSVYDIVQAKLLVLEDPRADYGSFNIGTGKRTSIIDVARTLTRLYGKDFEPEVTQKYRKGDIRDCFADISRLTALGYVPKVPLEDGLRELVAWGETVEAEDQVGKAHEELVAKGLVD